MAQHDYVIANGTGAAVRSDLNNALAAIVSQNSGATEPATTYAFQFWADTTTGLLKLRNSSNNAWVTLFQLDGEWSTLPVENGTAAAPSIYFKDSGTDTGFYSPGTDQIGISTAGTSRLTIDANGNLAVDTNTLYVDAPNNRVGIGTSSPAGKVMILGADTTSFGTITNGALNLGTVNGTTNGRFVNLNFGYDSGATNAPAAIGFTYTAQTGNGAGALYFGTRSVTTDTAPTERMVITAAGNVGIGTTSPGYPLTVVSDASTQVLKICGRSSDNISNIAFSSNNQGTDYAFITAGPTYLATSVNGSERARIDSSGRLLVGTSTSRNNFFNLTTYNPRLQIEGTDYASSMASVVCNSTTDSTVLIIGRTRGTSVGSNTAISSGDSLGVLSFQGSDGSELVEGARIETYVDGTPGANDMPGRLVFSTTADGASSPTERMRITQTGVTKLSNYGSYVGATDNTHEINTNNSGNSVIHIVSRNASFGADVTVSACLRSANSGYRLFGGYSGDGSSTPFSDVEFNLRGDGNGYADGTWNGGGADYAEFFEWSDFNPNEEDRRGISVVLDGNKIREAVAGEDPIGVISGNPSVIGDAAWNKWSGKYLRDEFGTYLLDENGDRQLNPAYDPDQEYIPREQRPEWDCVGLMGKLRIRKGQITGSRWIKMRDISDTVEEWLVR